ncbi:MAG: hypothetical protein JNG41_06580, partial [Dialister sp.]|nr:hypothetical protein [Dialister sp.]
MQMERSLTQPI